VGVANAAGKGKELEVERRWEGFETVHSRHVEAPFDASYDSSRYQLDVGWTME
jgi:hypothetical protein